ncbi:MAG: hypothetical protein QF570_13925 [Myxococcota bacterium]|nr:hypothetical protein [Myxococcota bacterium]
MGLIAREVEGRGIATVSLSSALSITASVNPPRGVYTDYPLGRTAGKPHDPASQDAIVRAAIDVLATASTPGTIRELDLHWSENDAWKDGVMRPQGGGEKAEDDRAERTDVPQYQFDADREAVDPACPTCFVP